MPARGGGEVGDDERAPDARRDGAGEEQGVRLLAKKHRQRERDAAAGRKNPRKGDRHRVGDPAQEVVGCGTSGENRRPERTAFPQETGSRSGDRSGSVKRAAGCPCCVPPTRLAECQRCQVLAHVASEGLAACPRCGREMARGGVRVGFADAREVYGEPGTPYAPPAAPPAKERQFVLRCADGCKARSRDEVVVDDWLSARRVPHEREPRLKGMRPDWRVGNVYIELWGLAGQQGYEKRREEKLALYRARRLRLIEILPEDVDRLDDKLGVLLVERPWVGRTLD